MEKLFVLLKNPKFLTGSLTLLIVAFLVLICIMAGIAWVKILLLLFVLIIGWNVYLLIKRRREAKQSSQLEDSFTQQADEQVYSTRPDKRDDISALKSKFEKAVAALKSSKLAKGKPGNTALYALPWYLIIGPPGCGKSTVLRHSGLEFPYVDPDSDDPKVKGLGGTKNCDFWFTTDGILLDTAGRYVTPMAQAEDRQEWHEFLKFLKKHRRKTPINGVIVAVSLAEEDDKFFGVLTSEHGKIEQHAKNIRARIDELTKSLDVEFPVYVLFTKCDMLNGFVEFFDDLGRVDCSQVWGYTLSKEEWQSRHPQRIFKDQFKQLYKYLYNRRLVKLGSERKSERKHKIFTFPLQFLSGRKKLAWFVEKLFEHNSFVGDPVFRGFYFTSGTQEGTPIDRVISSMATEYGFTSKELHEPPKEVKSYFIQDFFSKIVFPDQSLVARSSKGDQKNVLVQLGISAAAIILFASVLLGMSMSYRGNLQRLSNISYSSTQLDSLRRPLSSRDFVIFENFRRQLAELDQGPSLGLGCGMYRGDTVREEARELYIRKLKELVLKPIKSSLVNTLNTPPRPTERIDYSSTLKTYLMLTGSCEVDTSYLSTQLFKVWHNKIAKSLSQDSKDLAARQLSVYTQQLAINDKTYGFFKEDMRLVANARSQLLQADPAELIFNRLIDQGQEQITYSPISPEQNVLKSRSKLRNLFTQKGWTTIMGQALSNLNSNTQQADCVLGGQIDTGASNQSQMSGQLDNLYFQHYIKEWKNLIAGAYVTDFKTLKQAAEALEILTGQNSPLIRFFEGVVNNTRIASHSSSNGTSVVSLEREFKAIHQLIAKPEGENGQKPPLSIYIGELAKVQAAIQSLAEADDPGSKATAYAENVLNSGADELHSAWDMTHQLMRSLDAESSGLIKDLLKQPINNSWAVVAAAAQRNLNKLWKAQVYNFYRNKLQGKYPFATSTDDVLLTDVINFFKPGNGILPGFFEEHLSAFAANGWRTKKWNGKGISIPTNTFRNADKITRGLFPDGSAKPLVSFDLEPQRLKVSGNYCMALRYYGADFDACGSSSRDWALQWPNSDSEQKVILVIYRRDGKARSAKLTLNGEWSLFRFLDSANHRRNWQSYNQLNVSWVLQSHLIQTPVGFLLKPKTPRETLDRNFFSSFRCSSGL